MAVQGNRMPVIEPTDPLYIHPSDNPGIPLVSNPFNGENFDNWKRSVEIALSAKHKYNISPSHTLGKEQCCGPLLALKFLN